MAIFIEHPPSIGAPKGLRSYRGSQVYGHLTADTEQELLEYAAAQDISQIYYRKKVEWDFHFDIRGRILLVVQADPEVLKLPMDEYLARINARRKKKSKKT